MPCAIDPRVPFLLVPNLVGRPWSQRPRRPRRLSSGDLGSLSGDGHDDLETRQSCVDWGKAPERGGHHRVLCTCWCGDLECRHQVVVRLLGARGWDGTAARRCQGGPVWPPSPIRSAPSKKRPAAYEYLSHRVEEGYSTFCCFEQHNLTVKSQDSRRLACGTPNPLASALATNRMCPLPRWVSG